jgi:hypothetical protein
MVRQSGTVGRFLAVVFGIAALLVSYSRPACARTSSCETRTQRNPSDVIVSLADADHPQLPAQGVKLVPGEVLCVTGDVDESGDLRNLRLAPTFGDNHGPIIELELDRSDLTRLFINHSGARWLYYDALRLVTEQDVAVPARTAPVPPHRSALETWEHGVRKLILYGFRFGLAPSRVLKPPTPVRDTSKLNLSVTFGVWGGERMVHLDELDRALARDGFVPFERVGIMGGLDMDFTIGRVRAGVGLGGGRRTTPDRGGGAELSAGMTEVAFTAGFDVIRYDQFHAFLGSGLGVGELFVDHPSGSTAFPQVEPWEGKRVKFSAWQVPLDIGTDYFVPFGRASSTERWMLQLGVRVGYTEQLGSGDWKTDVDKNSRDLSGPNVDLSGPRARLVIGIGAQNGWSH